MILNAKKIIMFCSLLNVSTYSYCLQELNDVVLSNSTGQDGITITINPAQDITAVLAWTDKDGIAASQYGFSSTHTPAPASVVLGEGTATDTFKISKGLTKVAIDSDGGSAGAYVNMHISLPSTFSISTGSIFVAGKNSSDINSGVVGNHQNKTKILDDMKFILNDASLNINLGSQPQGSFAYLTGVITDGLQIENLKIVDNAVTTASSGIAIDRLILRDNLGDDLTLDTNLNLLPTGMEVNLTTGKKFDVFVEGLKFGNFSLSRGVGDLAVIGLQLGERVMTITGH